MTEPSAEAMRIERAEASLQTNCLGARVQPQTRLNIAEAIAALKAGAKVTQAVQHTVGSWWLEIEYVHRIDQDPSVEEPNFPVIYFCVEPITTAHRWIMTCNGTRNEWRPTQDDLFAEWRIVG